MFYWTPINKNGPQDTSLDQPNFVKVFDITSFFFGFLPVKEMKLCPHILNRGMKLWMWESCIQEKYQLGLCRYTPLS